MSRPLSQDPGAVLSALRSSLRLRRRAGSLRPLPRPTSLFPARAGGVAVPRRRPSLPARAEVWGPAPNRVGPRPSRGPFVGGFGGAPRGLRGDSRSTLSRTEAGARLQPGGVGGAGGGPGGRPAAPSSSPEKDERTAAAGGIVGGRAQDERPIGLSGALAALAAREDSAPRGRRAHDRRHRRSGRASASRRGSGSGRRSHSRPGSVRRLPGWDWHRASSRIDVLDWR